MKKTKGMKRWESIKPLDRWGVGILLGLSFVFRDGVGLLRSRFRILWVS